MLALALVLLACGPTSDPTPETVAWSKQRAPLAQVTDGPRSLTPLRAIVHLHSPYSHDACDGHGWEDDTLDEACLDDLRAGLCDDGIDVAFVTDHPDHAAWQPFADLLLSRGQDARVTEDGRAVGNRIACDDGREVTWLPGFEDVLMPVAMNEHAGEDAADSHRLYNGSGAESVDAERAAGGVVLVAHTEGRSLAELRALQGRGLAGVEIFNLHAMFAPDIREEDLGLDPFAWLEDAKPFTDPQGTAEPDLLFLAVLQEQAPSVASWDALLAEAPMVGVAGSDAHQNAIPFALRDGERGDSYRRVLSWFSNVLLADDDGAAAAEEALSAGRLYAAFEALGTPDGFDLRLVDGAGGTHEMGSDAPPGLLMVSCPTLAPGSPRGVDDPETRATVFRDGVPWRTGCGWYEVDGPATYRVRVDIVPHHLRPFLGDDPEPWMRPFPWVYSNAIRVVSSSPAE